MIATIADLAERIPVLWSPDTQTFGADENILNNLLLTAQDIVEQGLSPFYGNDLKLSNYRFTLPIKLTTSQDFQSSWGQRLRKIKNNSANIVTDNEYIIIEATDNDESYKVYGSISGNLGEGDTSSDFTSNDNSFSILTGDWQSDTIKFNIGDRFIFSRTWHEPILHMLTSLWAAHNIIEGRYMSEAANDLDFGSNSFISQYHKMFNELISADGTLTLKAPKATYINPNFTEKQDWEKGYDINYLGIDKNG